jgi:hypothetical protein
MKRIITETVVVAVPFDAAIAQARSDPWSMFAGSDPSEPDERDHRSAGHLPPAIDLGPVQDFEHGLRCHLRWTPDAGQLCDRWVRSTVSLTAHGGETSVNMTTRYLSEANVGRAYGTGALTHRSITCAASRITEGIRAQLERAWAAGTAHPDGDVTS